MTSSTQAAITAEIRNGRNVFISGVGGCGKTHLLKQLYATLCLTHRCLLTSTTGISAYNLGGVTVHSWCKIIIPKDIDDTQRWLDRLVATLMKRRDTVRKYRDLQLLFLDEVSMLGANFMDVLNYVCKKIRNNSKPFGGIQLVVSGDMLQLAPVQDGFPFESEAWETLNLKYFRLVKAWRFDNQRWVDLLSRARVGALIEEDKQLLQSRVGAPPTGGITPIFLASTNKVVDGLNRVELDKIGLDAVIFRSTDSPTPSTEVSFMADPTLTLKIGSQVMLLANLDIAAGLTNGSRGVVLDFAYPHLVKVRFEEGIKDIEPFSFQVEHKEKIYTRLALPLKLAFATSIHKSQSLTLSSVEMDIGKDVFCDGQSYVALSRCKSLEGLFIRSLDLAKIKPNLKALEFETAFLKTCVDL